MSILAKLVVGCRKAKTYHRIAMYRTGKSEEWTRFYRYRLAAGEISALHARFVSHRYPRHSHDHFVIGLVKSGAQSYSYRNTRHVTPAGHAFIVNPDEAHTGEAADATGYVYQTLCFEESLVRNLHCDAFAAAPAIFLKGAVFGESELIRALSHFHTSLSEGAPTIELDGLFYEAVTLLFQCHGDAPHSAVKTRCEHEAVVIAREYIESNFGEDISLLQLSQVASLSPFYLARAFRDTTGLPPHAYLDCVRLRRARLLLDRGEPIASVALSVGYADQSHMTKRFKRMYGITPGQFSRPRPHSGQPGAGPPDRPARGPSLGDVRSPK